MYTIAHNARPLFDPRIDGYPIQNPKLIREANRIGTLSFTIFPTHPEYGQIKSLASIIDVYRDGRLIFRCRPAYSRRNFRGGLDYKCEEITAALNDYRVRPTTYTGPADEFLIAQLNEYNSKAAHQILLGNVTIFDEISVDIPDYPGTWEMLQRDLIGKTGGYLVPRYSGSNVYLDYLREEDLPVSSQSIRFGENLTDLFIETDTETAYSSIIPIGGIPSGQTEKIGISSVNDGLDYVMHPGAVALYGVREIKKEFGDITDPAELMEAAETYLAENAVKFRKSVELRAIDLHNANADIESFDYMHWVHAESELHDLSENYVLTRDEIPLASPSGTKINLGGTRRTFSESVSDFAAEANTAVVAAQNAAASAGAASISAGTASTSSGQSYAILASIIGGEQSNAVFRLYQNGDNTILKVNPAYKFYVNSYDVAEKLAEI